MGDRLFPLTGHGHARALPRVPTDRRIDRTVFARHPADQGAVKPFDRAGLQLPDQMCMGGQRFGDNHQAGRILIQPMHNTGPGNLAEHRVIGQQPIEQGALPVAGRRMHHQTGRLIDHQNMGIFISDAQVHGLRQKPARLGIGQRCVHPHQQGFAPVNLMFGLCNRSAVHIDPTGLDPLLQAIARMLGNHVGQHLIQPTAVGSGQAQRAIILRIVFQIIPCLRQQDFGRLKRFMLRFLHGA